MKLQTQLTIILILFASFCFSQETELFGDIIYYDSCNNTTHPVSNAFDGNTNSYFMSCPNTGNWIGYDLGEKHVITKVVFAPRMDSDYRNRLQLGIFEGANSPDFGDAIALHIIPGLTERDHNEQMITSSRGFRYVRFVFPTPLQHGKSSYMSLLKFYGYRSDGNDNQLPQLTNLPTINIHTVSNEDIVEKKKYIRGIISIVYNDGKSFFSDSLDIRGRGNSSWSFPKKPYRIKLDNSTKLMGLPAKAKNWTLINNYGDKTLMRNILAFDFSRRLEMAYTSPAIAVDVVLNGDYKGTYQLSDHIDVRKNRVDVEEMTANDITGGYMLEIDAYAYPDEPQKFTSNPIRMPVTIKYPKDDEITSAQAYYIENHFNKLMNAVNNKNMQQMDQYLDIESFLRYFLVGEYSGNTDTYWSTRVIKNRDEDRLYFGPVWDFDLAFENDNRTYPINSKADRSNEWLSLSRESSAAGNAKDMVRNIIENKTYSNRLEAIYTHYRDNKAIDKDALFQVVDSLADLLNESQRLNFIRWQNLNQIVHLNPKTYGSYEGEVDNIKNYIGARLYWMDRKLNYDEDNSIDKIGDSEYNRIKLQLIENNLIVSNLNFPQDIQIYDMMGKSLIELYQYMDDFKLNLKQGIYLISVRSSQIKPYTIKFIVP